MASKSKKSVVVDEELVTGIAAADDATELDEDERADLDEDEAEGDEASEEGDEDAGAPVSAAGKASALRLVELLVEKKALALHVKKPSNGLLEGIARVLDAPGSLSARARKLSDTIVDSDDVDELFIDDETLAELLKRW